MTSLYKTQMTKEIDLDRQDSVKYIIPNLTGHAESEVEVLVVMRKMVLLHLLEIGGQAGVVHTRQRIREESVVYRMEDLRVVHAIIQHV